MTSTAEIIYEGKLRTLCTHTLSQSQIETDAPLDNEGQGIKFSPTDLLATSLGACMLTVMGIKANNHQWNIDGSTCSVYKEMADGPRRVSRIGIELMVPESAGINEKGQKILETVALNCPVALSINPEISLDVIFHWGDVE